MRKLLVIFALVLACASCVAGDDVFQVVTVPGGDSGGPEGDVAVDSPVVTLAIRPAYTKVVGIGKTLQLTADIFLDDDSVIEDVQKSFAVPGEESVDHVVEWETDNFGVATVDENGLVTTVSAGDAFIFATVDGLENMARVIVEAEGSMDPNVDTTLPPP